MTQWQYAVQLFHQDEQLCRVRPAELALQALNRTLSGAAHGYQRARSVPEAPSRTASRSWFTKSAGEPASCDEVWALGYRTERSRHPRGVR
jgi:hypothetical protein